MITGVYEIKNKLNNHRYVGSSINIYKRFYEHKRMLTHENHHSNYLQKAWDKYGETNFEFNILETCEPIKDTLLFIEQKYLDLNPEYNICKNSRNTQGVVFLQSRKDKIGFANSKRIIKDSTRLKHKLNGFTSCWAINQMKPIYMLDITTNKVLKEFNSMTQAAKYLGNPNKRINIKRVIKGMQKQAYGYKWKLK